MKTQITILLMILSAFAAQAAPSSPSIDEAKSFFEGHYSPKASDCAMESGRIVPLWENAQMTADGLSVPILTEKTTEWRLSGSDNPYEMVQKSLIARKGKKGNMFIAVRCLVGDGSNGLVLDVDINTNELLALQKVMNGRVVYKEADLDKVYIEKTKNGQINSEYGTATINGASDGVKAYIQSKVSSSALLSGSITYSTTLSRYTYDKAYERPEIQSILKEYSLRARKSD